MIEKTLFYTVNTWYAVTINPKDAHQHFNKANRFGRFVDAFNELCLSAFGAVKIPYIFTAELSEPRQLLAGSSGPRLHVHGLIMFDTTSQVFHFLCWSMHKISLYGIADFDVCNDLSIWCEYMSKQRSVIPHKPFHNNEDLIDMYKSFLTPHAHTATLLDNNCESMTDTDEDGYDSFTSPSNPLD